MESGAQTFLKTVPSQGISHTKLFETTPLSKTFVRLIPWKWPFSWIFT
jgi:hypothetical protein